MAEVVKVCTGNFGKGAQDIEVYKKLGGYANISDRLFNMSQFEVIDYVQRSASVAVAVLASRPGMKWSFVPRNSGKPVYIVVNADEGEGGTFKDHFLMMEDPHRLIEGLIIAAWALGSRAAYIYCRGEFLPCIESLNKALNQAYAAGYLGENICGTKFSFDIFVHRGAGAYICGEETALINSLEGQKGQPRLKPPFPAVSGAWKSPTCVNNVETIMALPWIFQHDPSEYAKMGTPASGGTKVFCISGDVKNPGVYEAPLGTPMMTMINDYAGGVVGGNLKAVLPGGSSCAPLNAGECAVATMDYECLASMKTMFGSGAMIVINDTHNMAELLNVLGNFYSHESCGQCTPCREGTGLLHRILNQIVEGKGHDGDVELMQSLSGGFGGVTICPLSISLGGPVSSYTAKFRADFDELIAKNPDHAKPRVQENYRPGIFW